MPAVLFLDFGFEVKGLGILWVELKASVAYLSSGDMLGVEFSFLVDVANQSFDDYAPWYTSPS